MRPNAVQVPRQGYCPHLRPETGTQGPHGCDRGVLQLDCLVPESAGRLWSKVGAGHARKCAGLPLAASRVLRLPHPLVGNSLLRMCPPAGKLRCDYNEVPPPEY